MKILIQAVMDIDPAHADRLVREAEPLISAAREEPGCEAYNWSLDPLMPGRVHVFEAWADEASLAHHFTLPAYTDMRRHLRSCGDIRSWSRKYRVDLDEPIYDAEGRPRAEFLTTG